MAKSKDRKPLKTEEIADWISKIKRKKITLKRQKRKNLFVEAILTNVLYQAETELKQKQQQRLQRWRSIQNTWTRTSNNSGNTTDLTVWGPSNCEELISLDNFMSQLKQIKVPVER
ncbi:hypothetical protein ILUMI_09074 [Ignelater luminosus]|uniref:Uncharacterized protein n=1 Tax=Ignelater luminosus TaxID=2038154 RepID=A0A8K0D5Q4_IGNLU|nr:hypothetical protein ILUMI_09074 [Ignelater luminosus]